MDNKKVLRGGFGIIINRQCLKTPEGKLAAAVLVNACIEGCHRASDKKNLKSEIRQHNITKAREFLTTDSVVRNYWADMAGIEYSFLERCARLEFDYFDKQVRKPLAQNKKL